MSLQTRCRNVKIGLENELANLKVDVIPKSLMAYGKGESTELMISFTDKLVCEISFNEKTYKISTLYKEWKEETTYSGTNDGKSFSYYVDKLDECTSEVRRLVEYARAQGCNKRGKNCYVWPETSDDSERLTNMVNLSKNVFDGSSYEVRRTEKENEGCVNVFPKGIATGVSTIRRLAGIYVQKKSVNILVKEPLYSLTKVAIEQKGINKAEIAKGGYCYQHLSIDKVIEILQIFAKAE